VVRALPPGQGWTTRPQKKTPARAGLEVVKESRIHQKSDPDESERPGFEPHDPPLTPRVCALPKLRYAPGEAKLSQLLGQPFLQFGDGVFSCLQVLVVEPAPGSQAGIAPEP